MASAGHQPARQVSVDDAADAWRRRAQPFLRSNAFKIRAAPIWRGPGGGGLHCAHHAEINQCVDP